MNVRPTYIILYVYKADFIIFHFELEILLKKLVKLCSYFFEKKILNKKVEYFIFIKKVNIFSNRSSSSSSTKRKLIWND